MSILKSSKLIAVLVAIVALVWIGSGFLASPDTAPEESKAPIADQSEEEQIFDVRVRDITAQLYSDDVVVTGRTQASKNVVLRAESSGQVQEILKEEGDIVEAEEALAKLEVRDRAAKLREAQERVNQRQIEYNAAKKLENKGFNSKVRLAQALADLEEARAQLRQTQVDKNKTSITAPFAGIINRQDSEIGDYLSVGDQVFTLVDLDPIELVGFVSERRVRDIQKDGLAIAEFLEGETLEGTVSFIAAAADSDTRTFRVVMKAPNADLTIKEGLTAKIRIPVAKKKAHKISPSVLTLNDAGKVGVKMVNNKNIVEFSAVKILADTPEAMWVTGLPETARIITVGQEFVQEGQTVNPVQAQGDGLL